MTYLEGKTLYNSLRINWLMDPTLKVESWQVEDYRKLSLNTLFERLLVLGLPFDERQFHSYADGLESPEELTTYLLQDADLEPEQQDQFYLILFEIWRRLIPEKQSLSIFCDELDHQISLYDKESLVNGEQIQDILANFQVILDENCDQGIEPSQVFQTIASGCAHDVAAFLYEFIAEQIDSGNIAYATELLEGFDIYLPDSKWFGLLNLRILATKDHEAVEHDLKRFIPKVIKEENFLLNLELLSFIVQEGGLGEFREVVKRTIPLIETESDLLELLATCVDFYTCVDKDTEAQMVQSILDKRKIRGMDVLVKKNDPAIVELLAVLK